MSYFPTPVEVARQWFERIWIQRDSSAIYHLMAPHGRGYLEPDVIVTGPDDFVAVFHVLTTTFPDMAVVIEDIVGDMNHACVRWRVTGSHTGSGLGVPPTGKHVTFHGITWLTVQNGQIVEGWDTWNQGALLTELGVQ